MKIGRISVKSFKSISSIDFSMIGSKVALVGGNESGKSNVLLAIQKFLTKEKIDPEDRNQPDLKNTEIEIGFRDFTPEESKILCDLFKTKSITELRIHRVDDIYTIVSPKLPDMVVSQADEVKSSADENSIEKPAEDTTEKPAEDTAGKTPEDSTGKEEINDTPEPSLTHEQITEKVLELLPHVVLIKTIQGLIKGKNIPLAELYPNDKGVEKSTLVKSEISTILNFLALGGITKEDVMEVDTAKKHRIINKKAAEISKKISSAWKQERIEIRMSVDSKNLVIEFKDCGSIPDGEDGLDQTKWIWTYPEDRSDGFRWFVTFYSSYLYGQSQAQNIVFLIDEAGGYLNKRAQIDLLAEFDRLSSGNNQIIYATHSKYMVSWDFKNDVYAVVKNRGLGTTVSERWWSKYSQDELPPPLDEIGVTWSGDLLASENLIVEGPVDLEVLRKLKTFFPNGEIPEDVFLSFKLIPGMGVFDSMVELAKACEFHHKKSFLLFDSDPAGTKGKNDARSKGLQAEDVNTLCGSPVPHIVSIEDLLPRKLYFEFLNKEGEAFSDRWTEIKMVQDADSLGLVEAIKQRLLGPSGFTPEEVSVFLRDHKYSIAMNVLKGMKLEDLSGNQQSAIKDFYKHLKRKLEQL